MSSRVLKKLHGEKDIVSALGIDGMSESDDGGASYRGTSEKPFNNRFELVNILVLSLIPFKSNNYLFYAVWTCVLKTIKQTSGKYTFEMQSI